MGSLKTPFLVMDPTCYPANIQDIPPKMNLVTWKTLTLTNHCNLILTMLKSCLTYAKDLGYMGSKRIKIIIIIALSFKSSDRFLTIAMCASSYSLTFVTISIFLSMVSIPFSFNLLLQVIGISQITETSASTEATSSSFAS